MAVPFGAQDTSTIQSKLIGKLRDTLSLLPDARKGKNITYEMLDAGLSAFAVFFMQSPSFLAHQKAMQQAKGQDNAETLFGVHNVPSDNQIRNLLDSVPPETLYSLFHFVFQELKKTDKLNEFKVLDDQLLVALDGVEYYSSTKIRCDHCAVKNQKSGTERYAHTALTPVVLSPHQPDVIPLTPEFLTPQDGERKQDSELKAACRWLKRERAHLPDKVTVLGDDLYCHQPWCEQLALQHLNFILVCKPSSHQTLYEWVDDFERAGQVQYIEKRHWTGKRHITQHYRFMNQVPLRNSDDAMLVNWCEIIEVDDQGRQLYKNSFATNFTLSAANVVDIVMAGRSRWKIENENNNTLKTKGYHFGHNFGHGKQYLSFVLATLIILAFLFHTVLGWFDKYYQLLREALPSRKTFFDDIRALTRYLCFDHWQGLLKFMLRGLKIPIPEPD